jgi:hypothetical protein
MVVRKKNLLDAFQAASPDARASTRPVSTGSAGASAGANGAAARAPQKNIARADADRADKLAPQWSSGTRAPAWRRILKDRVVQLALVAGVVCIAALVWLKPRASVDAGEPSGAVSSAGALLRPSGDATSASTASADELAKRNLATAQAGSLHDQQFMNPLNKFTVRVKTFGNDAAGQAAARALHQYFVKENLPVVLPIGQGKVCVLYVGHDEKKKDADKLASFIQRMSGPASDAKKLPFADAYVVNIDDVVKR